MHEQPRRPQGTPVWMPASRGEPMA